MRVWFQKEERESQGPDMFTKVLTAHMCYLQLMQNLLDKIKLPLHFWC